MRNPSPTSRSVKILFSFFLAIFLTDAAVVSVSLRAEKKVFSSFPFAMMMVVAEVERRRASNKKKEALKHFSNLQWKLHYYARMFIIVFVVISFLLSFVKLYAQSWDLWVRVMLYADAESCKKFCSFILAPSPPFISTILIRKMFERAKNF